jgi:hypothetical protein
MARAGAEPPDRPSRAFSVQRSPSLGVYGAGTRRHRNGDDPIVRGDVGGHRVPADERIVAEALTCGAPRVVPKRS